MTEDELIRTIRELAYHPKRRTTCGATYVSRPELPPPASPDSVEEAEWRLGFSLPPLLCRLYVEVASGGFGPGYGLVGLQGGFIDDDI